MANSSTNQLTAVTQSVLDTALSHLKNCSMRCDRYRADLAELDAQRRKATCDVGNIALSAGVDILWFQWAEKRRSALNKDLARALVEEEHARAKAKRAFGRNQALSKILGQSVHRR